ncbi:MAG TPA: RluA family pseudouridine synthase [Candidatus Nitrosopolaris sp.]|nr:RluA family pseudouridine synthase [Candidatus Nitrosopolaris sp.]
MRRFKVGQAGAGQRADVFIAAKFPRFSRSFLEYLFDAGSVKSNDKIIKASHKLQTGDKIKVEDGLLKIKPAKIKLPVVHEDDDVVVIDKPAGVLAHSKGALNNEATVASFIRSKIKDKTMTGNRAGIVHRLDRPTSGLIITARTAAALQHLQRQFSKRKTDKTYLAVVEGWPEPAEALIDAPIERNPRRPQTFRVAAGGKPAQTHYKTLRQLQKNRKKYAFLELKPATGRTHQLRIHLSYLGHPIVGDSLYGHTDGQLLLHASRLEITLPSGHRKVFESPAPRRIKEFIA